VTNGLAMAGPARPSGSIVPGVLLPEACSDTTPAATALAGVEPGLVRRRAEVGAGVVGARRHVLVGRAPRIIVGPSTRPQESAMPTAHFVWYELMTPDAPAAARFYSEVVGWKAEDSGMPGVQYTLFKVGEAQVAGLMATPAELHAAGVPAAWSGYIAVDDVDVMEARVLQAGGKVVRPADDIPGIGRFAFVADPQGSAFALFKPLRNDPPPMPPANAPGTTGWHELRAIDGPAVWDFYASLFGWTKGEALPMGELGVYQIFQIDGVPSGAVMTKEADQPAPGWRFYTCVADIHAAAERVRKLGGTVAMGPSEVPGGSWVLNARDPQGAVFALTSTPA
jgi:uncharacterized protein